MILFKAEYRPLWIATLTFLLSSCATLVVVTKEIENSIAIERNEELTQVGSDLAHLLQTLHTATEKCRDFLLVELNASVSLAHAITQAGAFCHQGMPLADGWVVIGRKEPDGSYTELYNSGVAKALSSRRVPANLEAAKEINFLFNQSLQTGASLLSNAVDGPVTGEPVLTTVAALQDDLGTYVSLAFDPAEIAKKYSSRLVRQFDAFAVQISSYRWVYVGEWPVALVNYLETDKYNDAAHSNHSLHQLGNVVGEGLVTILHLDDRWSLAGVVATANFLEFLLRNWRGASGLIVAQALILAFFSFWFVLHLRERKIEELDRKGQLIRQSDAQKASLIKSMAHEIRSPIIRLIGALELARASGRKNKEPLLSSLASATTILQLCDDLLDLGQMGAGEYKSVISSFNIESMLEEIKNEYAQYAHERKAQLTTRFDGIDAIVLSDRLRIRQIITNLLHNALRASSGGSVSVVVSVSKQYCKQVAKSHLKIVVSDNGIGMSPDVLSNIFDEFVTYSENGTGLGLSVVKRILQRLDGKVEVESALGVGSVFTVTIPLLSERKILSAVPSEHTLRGCDILLVEDEDIIRKVTVKKLLEAGAKVSTASDGQEAVIVCGSRKFDFVLMDLEMPNLSGLDACRKIREIKLNKHTPIFGLSSHLRKHRWESAVEAGMDDLFTKPIEISVIAAVFGGMVKGGPRKLQRPIASEDSKTLNLQVFEEACDLSEGSCNWELLNGFVVQAYSFKRRLEADELADLPRSVHSFKGVSMIFGASLLTEKLFSFEAKLNKKSLDEDWRVSAIKEVADCIDVTVETMRRLAQASK